MAETCPNKKMAVMSCLAQGMTMTDASKSVGVPQRTIHNWVKQPDFKAGLAQLETEAIRLCARRLAGLTAKALDVLAEIMADTEAGAGPRIRAACAVLENSMRLRDSVVMADRLEALEQAMQHSEAASLN